MYGECSTYHDCAVNCLDKGVECIAACIEDNESSCKAGASVPEGAESHFFETADLYCSAIAGGHSWACYDQALNCLENGQPEAVCEAGFEGCNECICEFNYCVTTVETKDDLYACMDKYNFCKNPSFEPLASTCDGDRCLQGCSSIEDDVLRDECASACDGHYLGNCAACDNEEATCRENGHSELCDEKKEACVDCMIEFELCNGDETRSLGECFSAYAVCKGGAPSSTHGDTYEPTSFSAIEEGQNCVRDQASRTLTGPMNVDAGMTAQVCADFCHSQGFEYFGTEWYTECFCGSAEDVTNAESISQASCNTPCGGDDTEMCGGGWALSVYAIDESSESSTVLTATYAVASTTVVMGLGFGIYSRRLRMKKDGEVAVLSDSA